MPHRLSDLGYAIKTGPLVWNRHKDQLRESHAKNCYPLIWAESVLPDGGFAFRADRRNHLPYINLHASQNWLVTTRPCALLQRTTAKEQHRRLIAGCLPMSFIRKHGGVVIENHLNLIQATNGTPLISTRTLVALLNSKVIDEAFRCISGSVAVSAYELGALPLPPPDALAQLEKVIKQGAAIQEIEEFLKDQYLG